MVTRSRAKALGSRRRERGVALFVVVLAITLLTGVGLYTVHASALSARAAGNGREALQTQYLAELGTLAIVSELSANPFPYINEARKGDLPCEMNQGIDPTLLASCLQRVSADLAPPGGALFANDSFGPLATTAGAFRTEITDVASLAKPVVGMDATNSNFRYYQASVTTIGQLRPSTVGAGACVENVMQVAGQHTIRAQVVVGPLGGI